MMLEDRANAAEKWGSQRSLCSGLESRRGLLLQPQTGWQVATLLLLVSELDDILVQVES